MTCFYMKECGAKGIFFDCLGWVFPPDFRPRSFMRYPGDTNRMAIKFMDEIAACVKECDPEGVFFGEGSSFDAPIDLLSVNFNPVRAIDGRGPRDFLLELNAHGSKRIVLDQGALFSVAAGMVAMLEVPENAAKNRYLTRLLKEKGGSRAFTILHGELAVLEAESLLVVPKICGCHPADKIPDVVLTGTWSTVTTLTEQTDGTTIGIRADGKFPAVPAGIYKMA